MAARLSPHRKLLLLAADLLLINLATVFALTLRFTPNPVPPQGWHLYLANAAPLTLLRLVCFWRLGLYRIAWRYVGPHDLLSVVQGVLASSALLILGRLAVGKHGYPVALLIVDAVLACILLGGLRLTLRAGTALRAGLRAQRRQQRRLLIVGAGDHAEALAREVGRHPDLHYQLVGFLDDDPAKHGLLIHGIPVLGPIDTIGGVVRRHAIQEVIIAIPSASGAQIRRVLLLCERLPVRIRTTPGFAVLQPAGEVQGAPVRDVAPEDLLRRPAVRVDVASVAGYLQGETVLITGAGGSIGAELARQVLGFGPEKVLLLGRGENSIFEVDQVICSAQHDRVLSLIADVRDRERLEQIFTCHRPTVVFHAAAHKHVPLMEANPQEAVKNNVWGTRHLLELAGAHRVKRFVLISSDKAVNPSSVMGATKRIAEMLLQAQARRTPETRFMAVRFGNVLGSRGSVVQTMRRQIACRQPVSVTHPEMVRYFMTIPEAVQLVIQAGALGERGEIFVLDMGEPVRIMELARDLIRLSGFVPGVEIPIEITGIRPGEKLYEELLTAQEGISSTQYERILIARPAEPDVAWLYPRVEELLALACAGRLEELRGKIAEIVPEYRCAEPPAQAEEPSSVTGRGRARVYGADLPGAVSPAQPVTPPLPSTS
jgi:FlaA1/EpsC-like NDP-sugar epimerase